MSRANLQNQPLSRKQVAAYPSAMRHPTDRRQEEDKPSRLLQMRENYQRRVYKEKEDRLVNMYEDNQRRNMERVDRVARGMNRKGTNPNSKFRQSSQPLAPEQIASSSSVRDFFRERRELEAKGGFVPPIDHHYKQARSRPGSGYSYYNSSAGVDRAQPLAPIQIRNNGTSSAPAQQTPFGNKSRLGKPSRNCPESDENANYKTYQRSNPPTKPSPRGDPSPRRGGRPSPATAKEDKMSDFQKWQMEQNKAREDRLKRVNKREPFNGRDSRDWDTEMDKRLQGGNDEINRKQQELKEKISRQQADLERLKKEREQEEEQDRQEAERLRKRQAADREQRKRQEQEQVRQRREEEAQARREEEQRKARARQESSHRFDQPIEVGFSQPSTQRSNNSYRSKQTSETNSLRRPVQQQQRDRHPPKQARPPSPEGEEDTTVSGPGSEFYAQVIEGEKGTKVKLVPCKLCGRKFADDRIQKHQSACKIAQKKRKVFDPTKMRTEGTEMAKYVRKGLHQKESKKKKKADWRLQHEDFINNIRYAKQMQEMEKQGVAAKDLPPPPTSHNLDLVPCPHCGRKFNESAAERHIPRCQGLKTRPVAVNKQR